MSGYNYRTECQFVFKHLLSLFIIRQNLDTVGRFRANFRAVSFLSPSFTCFITLLMRKKRKWERKKYRRRDTDRKGKIRKERK